MIKSIIKDLNLDKEIYKAGRIQNRISYLKNNFITPEGYNNHAELLEIDKKTNIKTFLIGESLLKSLGKNSIFSVL